MGCTVMMEVPLPGLTVKRLGNNFLRNFAAICQFDENGIYESRYGHMGHFILT